MLGDEDRAGVVDDWNKSKRYSKRSGGSRRVNGLTPDAATADRLALFLASSVLLLLLPLPNPRVSGTARFQLSGDELGSSPRVNSV